MAELTKYEIMLSDLNSLESQAIALANKSKDFVSRNKELEEQYTKLKKENFDLSQKISNLEDELIKFQKDHEENLLISLNEKERETLKVRINNLISRIDYHLSADRQV